MASSKLHKDDYIIVTDISKLAKYQKLFKELMDCPKDEPERRNALIEKINNHNLKDKVL